MKSQRFGSLAWIVIVMAFLVAAWMAFDGVHAFVTGDYVTPKEGEFAGKLGSWSRVVAAAGVPPRSTQMKTIFVVFGAMWLVAVFGYATRRPWGRRSMIGFAASSLWYLPFGTVLGAGQLVLLNLPPLRRR